MNRSIEDLSPYTKEFFEVFLKQKKSVKKPIGRAFFQLYIGMNNKLEPWLEISWKIVSHNLVLEIIVFKRVPQWTIVANTIA
jgi:hypothetical protein